MGCLSLFCDVTMHYDRSVHYTVTCVTWSISKMSTNTTPTNIWYNCSSSVAVYVNFWGNCIWTEPQSELSRHPPDETFSQKLGEERNPRPPIFANSWETVVSHPGAPLIVSCDRCLLWDPRLFVLFRAFQVCDGPTFCSIRKSEDPPE